MDGSCTGVGREGKDVSLNVAMWSISTSGIKIQTESMSMVMFTHAIPKNGITSRFLLL